MATNEALNDTAKILEGLHHLLAQLEKSVKAHKFNKPAPITPTAIINQEKLNAIAKMQRSLEDGLYQIALLGETHGKKQQLRVASKLIPATPTVHYVPG